MLACAANIVAKLAPCEKPMIPSTAPILPNSACSHCRVFSGSAYTRQPLPSKETLSYWQFRQFGKYFCIKSKAGPSVTSNGPSKNITSHVSCNAGKSLASCIRKIFSPHAVPCKQTTLLLPDFVELLLEMPCNWNASMSFAIVSGSTSNEYLFFGTPATHKNLVKFHCMSFATGCRLLAHGGRGTSTSNAPFKNSNSGNRSLPLTSTFANTGNVTPYLLFTNSWILLSSPGSCDMNWLHGKAMTCSPAAPNLSCSFCNPSYCPVKPHLDAVLTIKVKVDFQASNFCDDPSASGTVKSKIVWPAPTSGLGDLINNTLSFVDKLTQPVDGPDPSKSS
mmetsp:Transcript_47997/g.88346  ORF Transcript_47997/g.88346 Transcript_47997/m.88346 type:complete len:335 (+) Transcript_47997:547-1551(+)